MQFPWRWDGGLISLNLRVVWECRFNILRGAIFGYHRAHFEESSGKCRSIHLNILPTNTLRDLGKIGYGRYLQRASQWGAIAMSSLRPLLRCLHAALPDNIRRQVDIATISLQDTIQNWRISAYRVRASLPEGSGEGTVLYFGDLPQYRSWTHKLFGRAIEPTPIGRFSLLQILRGRIQALAADIILCPLNPWTIPLFARSGWNIVPRHVICTVDLTKPIKALTSSGDAKNELKVIRKLGYQFRELRDVHAFEEFYNEMLVPTITRRHRERAFLSSMDHLRQIFSKGYLLAAYLDSQWVAANLVVPSEHGVIVAANVGWRGGSDELMKKRVVGALKHELIIRGQDQGFKTLDLGSSNPFANDGSLNYKIKWNVNIWPPEIEYIGGYIQGTRSFIAVKFNLTSESAQLMLHRTPIFERYKGHLRVIGWDSTIPSTFRRQIDNGISWVNLAEIR